MLNFLPEELSKVDMYKLLTGTIIPRPIALVTSEHTDGTLNAAPFSFFNIVSSSPPVISISVQRVRGEMKDTARNIISKKEFVAHIVDGDNLDDVNKTAATLAPTESEIEYTKFSPVKSKEISTFGIKEMKVRFECELLQIVEIEESGRVAADLILGKIVCVHVNKELVSERLHIDYELLNPSSRLAGADYAQIGPVLNIERPK